MLYIVVGGSNNRLLNQFTVNAINRKVVLDTSEATSIGNLIMWVKASGEVNSFSEKRRVFYY